MKLVVQELVKEACLRVDTVYSLEVYKVYVCICFFSDWLVGIFPRLASHNCVYVRISMHQRSFIQVHPYSGLTTSQ